MMLMQPLLMQPQLIQPLMMLPQLMQPLMMLPLLMPPQPLMMQHELLEAHPAPFPAGNQGTANDNYLPPNVPGSCEDSTQDARDAWNQ